ncbi:MAG TPA: TMEM165/GDT1 family protein [Bacillota bacterium]|nr:TMEM165/GDT1 family protein [Bacillota bacterium]HOA34733.1 TMEM165/GDT1 family protein [Bacillota bacterium]HOJ83300.1 TMEM165/GDT1 family protein [Bacillota bacterium]HOL14991.1 TMEM165/GDT1 family protein [Bacillota bacterium]HPZ11201.1 TMEM165/GDT1 family protein [Bacillota bacterium]
MIAAASAAFISVFVAEFGDKTQLVSLSMAGRYPPLQVLGGAMTGLALVMGLAVGAGGVISAAIPPEIITLVSGLFFIIMGLMTLLRSEPERGLSTGRSGFYQTAAMIFLAELGDKTQMAALLLSAHFGRPVAVFAGAMAAMFLNHALAVFLGKRFLSRVAPRVLKIVTALLFIGIGLVMLLLVALGRV